MLIIKYLSFVFQLCFRYFFTRKSNQKSEITNHIIFIIKRFAPMEFLYFFNAFALRKFNQLLQVIHIYHTLALSKF